MRRLFATGLLATTSACAVLIGGCSATNQDTVPISTSKPQVRRLAWPAPRLHSPTVITLTPGRTDLKLDLHRDYVLKLPAGQPLRAPKGLSIYGGHNVVLVGGTLDITGKSGAMVLHDQTGVMHIEGIRITGPRLMEGIDLSESKGAVVQLENIQIGRVHGSYKTNHADLIQSWAGPRKLLIDGFVGHTDYQGFFLLPNQLYKGPPPQLFDFRNVYIDARRGGYALWRSDRPRFPLRLSNVFVSPNPAKPSRRLWLRPKPSPGDHSWSAVKTGAPAPLLKRVNAAGTAYDAGH
jgi:hypothetical protein